MAKNEKHALYLINPDTSRVELVHAEDVEAKQAAGWKQPTNAKPNGQPYNHEDDLEGQDAAADGAKKAADVKAKKDAEKQKAQDATDKAAEKAADKAAAEVADVPDFNVRVVE